MNFIQKRIYERKLKEEKLKEDAFKRSCCPSMVSLEYCMENLKNQIDAFSINKKHISTIDVERFINDIDLINMFNADFLRTLKSCQNKNFGAIMQRDKIDYMLKKKKEYRYIFERFYINFKRVSKGYDFPRRNEILGLMRNAFDFDSSKYHNPEQSIMIR